MESICFPALGWEFSISPVLVEFTLFGIPFSVRWYGLLIAVGFLLAVLYAVKTAKKRFDIDLDPMTDVVLVSTVLAVLGARVYYIIFNNGIETLWEQPLKVLRIWEGGLAIYGGVLAAFLTGIWMCKLKKVNMWAMFDLASIGFFIGQTLGRWGNFFNQEAFGGNTTLPWGMTGSIIASGVNGSGYDPALPVHPTFLYESLWCFLGFLLLHTLSKKQYTFKGKLFCTYIIWYGAGRFMIEGLRTDSLMLGSLRVSQVLALICVVGGVLLYYVLRTRTKKASAMPTVTPAPAFTEEEAENMNRAIERAIGIREEKEDDVYTDEIKEENNNGETH